MSTPYGQNSNCPPTIGPCKCPGAENNAASSACAGTFTSGGCGCGGSSSVLLSSGSFSFRRKLLSLDALNGISWNFGLDYLADNGVNDILGKGFNYPQNLRLVAGSGGKVILASGQNTLDTFLPSGGGYIADQYNCTQAELSLSGSLFTLTASDGTVSVFYDFTASTPGRLQSITDRYGNQQSYVWQRVGTLSQLVSVTDSYGRTIQYSYYGAEFGYCLSQITDFLGRRLNFQYDNLGHLVAVVTPSVLQAATGNTFPGGTAYVFQYDVHNPRPDRRDDLVKIWFPNEAAPFVDAATRTVNVAGVYASATPRYVVQYGQDPTDADMYGRVVQETVGDPANGVGGTYQYLYTTSGLPGIPFPGDPADAIVFRCVLTDRNDNQTVYDFNAAQMPVRVEVMRSRGKIDIPSTVTWPSYVTWTAYNNQNQPTVQILPAGNSVKYTYESGTISGLPSPYNRRVGLLTSRTEYPDNSYGITPVRSGSSGQSQLTETFFYEPIYNQLCARVERRGNPINGAAYFPPQNGGSATAARYATLTYYDYQKDDQTTVSGDGTLRNALGLTSGQIGSLYTFVNNQLSGAGLTGFPSNLGDINGDGTGSGTANAAPHLGNVVLVQHPTVTLINPDPNSGDSTQARFEVFTSNARGQTTTHTDANGNLTVYVRYPYNDPEGNGGITAPAPIIPANLGGKQYGRLKEVHVDANPDDVLSLVGGDGDLADFIPAHAGIAHTGIPRYNTPGVYLDLATRYEGGSGAGGSGCASCAYDAMGNTLAMTDPRGFTTRYDRNELGEVYRTISPQPYNFRVETYFDGNRNVTRVDTEDLQPAFGSADPSSALFAQFTPSGSGPTAHVPMQAGPGGSVRPGWFTNLYTFNLLDDRIEEDIDATGSTPANLLTTFLYDPNQNLIQITKPQGNIVEYDYDERNLRIATRVGRDAASGESGAVTVTAFDANGNLLQVIGPAYRGGISATAMIEDAFRSGLTFTHTGDLALNNVYDGFDRVIKAIDALGNYVDLGAGYTSDPFLDPDARVIRSDDYGTLGDGTTGIHLLASAKMRFDEAGRQYELEREVFFAGTSLPSGRSVTHNGGGLVFNSTLNNHTGPTVITTPGQSSYVLTRALFDAGGRTITTLADNTNGSNISQTVILYDGADRQINVKDALGNVVANGFDGAGNLVSVQRTENCTITGIATAEVFSSAMFYDCLNQLVLRAEQGADGTLNTNLVVYNNGPFWQLDGSTLVTCLGYDSRGNQVLSIDPKGNSSIAVFDGASRAIQTQQHLRQAGQGQNPPLAGDTFLPSGGASIVTTMILDGNGRQAQLIDDRGDVTLFAYDTLDREVQMTLHDGSTRTSGYDEAGDVIAFTDENGNQFSNTFDALGRKTGVAITPFAVVIGATSSQSFRYDGLSRTTFARNTANGGINADVTLAYDSLGRLLEEAQSYGGLTPRYVTNSAFTSYPVSGFTFPTVRVISSSFDLLYRRTLAHDTTGSGYDIAAWNFFGPSRVAQVLLGNGVTCTWMNNAGANSAVQGGVPGVPNPGWTSGDFLGYDGCGRMIAKRFLAPHSGLLVVGFSSEYDRAGNKFFERALHAEDRSHLYEPFDPVSNLPTGGYDSLDRLRQYQRGTLASTGGFNNAGGGSITSGGSITVPHTDTQRSYLLDGLGNWRNTGFMPAGGSDQTEVRQHNGLNQITRRQNPSAADPLINPTYDKNGNLTADGAGASYTWDALNRLVDVGTIQYAYDALNRRIRKTVSGVATDHLYSGWRCVEDRNGSNIAIAQYVWGIYLDELLQMQTYAPTGSQSLAAGTYYPLADLLYRTTALTDSTGTIVEAYDTDAYGNTLIFTAVVTGHSWWDPDAVQSATPACPFIFTGQRFDGETELYYYKRRYYAPSLGRFLSRDPVQDATEFATPYSYLACQPTSRLDPHGLQALPPWCEEREEPYLDLPPEWGKPVEVQPYPPHTRMPPDYPHDTGPHWEPMPGTKEWEEYAERMGGIRESAQAKTMRKTAWNIPASSSSAASTAIPKILAINPIKTASIPDSKIRDMETVARTAITPVRRVSEWDGLGG